MIIDLRRRLGGHRLNKISEELVGQSVMTVYNRKIYRVDKIDFDKTASETFTRNDGTEISFADYYKNTYKLEINDLQ